MRKHNNHSKLSRIVSLILLMLVFSALTLPALAQTPQDAQTGDTSELTPTMAAIPDTSHQNDLVGIGRDNLPVLIFGALGVSFVIFGVAILVFGNVVGVKTKNAYES